LHRLEKLGHGLDDGCLEGIARLGGGFFPKVDRVAGENAILLESERFRWFDHDTQRRGWSLGGQRRDGRKKQSDR